MGNVLAGEGGGEICGEGGRGSDTTRTTPSRFFLYGNTSFDPPTPVDANELFNNELR